MILFRVVNVPLIYQVLILIPMENPSGIVSDEIKLQYFLLQNAILLICHLFHK